MDIVENMGSTQVEPTEEPQIYWKGKRLEDLTDEELKERAKNFKNKMKVIYLNIIVEESALREINMILGKPEMDNEAHDKEIKKYLERMFAQDQVEVKLAGIIKYLATRIIDDEPTIMSIFKVHRDS